MVKTFLHFCIPELSFQEDKETPENVTDFFKKYKLFKPALLIGKVNSLFLEMPS